MTVLKTWPPRSKLHLGGAAFSNNILVVKIGSQWSSNNANCVNERVERFQEGQIFVVDEHHSGRPLTATIHENVLIPKDTRISVASAANCPLALNLLTLLPKTFCNVTIRMSGVC